MSPRAEARQRQSELATGESPLRAALGDERWTDAGIARRRSGPCPFMAHLLRSDRRRALGTPAAGVVLETEIGRERTIIWNPVVFGLHAMVVRRFRI